MITRIPVRVLSSPAISRIVVRISSRCPNCSRSPTYLLQPRRQPQRLYSTPSSSIPESSSIPPPPNNPAPKRSLRPYIYASIFALVGVVFAQYVNLLIAPPPLPLPDTHEDKLMVEYLRKAAEQLPLVKSLIEDPNWVHHEAYDGFGDEEKSHRLTTGVLAGARGVGAFQRVFYNEDTGEHVCIVWIGGAVAGWPGVTHGGLTATLMDESLGRCAIKQFPAKTGVTANLELNYLKPILTNAFYVIRAIPQREGATDQKQWVSGRLETLDGKVCVEAKALFVVPKKFKTRPIPKL